MISNSAATLKITSNQHVASQAQEYSASLLGSPVCFLGSSTGHSAAALPLAVRFSSRMRIALLMIILK